MSLQVIGVGLGRTGTMSLKLALEHLGFGPCYHMSEVLAGARRNFPLWLEVIRGKPDWDAIFDGFRATADYPGCTYWRELADYYPEARIVLSLRDPDDWFRSVSKTIFAKGRPADDGGPMAEFMLGAVFRDFGDRVADRDFMVDYFTRRNAEVIDTLPAERLLVHRPGDGWEPLCGFLGVPVPAEPYPRTNTAEDWDTERPFAPNSAVTGPEAVEEGGRTFIARMRERAFGAST